MVEVAAVAVGPVALMLPSLGIGHPLVDALYGLLVKCKGERPGFQCSNSGPFTLLYIGCSAMPSLGAERSVVAPGVVAYWVPLMYR